MDGLVSRQLRPVRGIVAGVSTATAELKCLLITPIQNHLRRHPLVNLTVFIDDLTLDTIGVNSTAVVQQIMPAAEDLAHDLEIVTRLPLAREKAAVVGNTVHTINVVRRVLRDLGGPPLGQVRALGCDFFAGKASARRSFAARAARFRNANIKRPSLRALGKVSKSASTKVFCCGIVLSLLFDSLVYGMFERSSKMIRKAAGHSLGIAGSKRSLDLGLATKLPLATEKGGCWQYCAHS